MASPKLACCNFLPDAAALRRFALSHGLSGVEWTLRLSDLPDGACAAARLGERVESLAPLEVRYHCAFARSDPGDDDPQRAARALSAMRRALDLVAGLGGSVVTIHVGLGLDSTLDLSWERTLAGLAELGAEARRRNLRLCLENLAWGWTSRPALYEKLLRKAGLWGTLDIGHARVSPAVRSRHFDLEDFVLPHPERILNAHIYHEEDDRGHRPPQSVGDISGRLLLLQHLPRCDWWVIEMREEQTLLQTLAIVRAFLDGSGGEGG